MIKSSTDYEITLDSQASASLGIGTSYGSIGADGDNDSLATAGKRDGSWIIL